MENKWHCSTVDDCLQLIINLGYDYDGYDKVEDLKSLIDELVDIARLGRSIENNKIKSDYSIKLGAILQTQNANKEDVEKAYSNR